jgi:hypothetical protein
MLFDLYIFFNIVSAWCISFQTVEPLSLARKSIGQETNKLLNDINSLHVEAWSDMCLTLIRRESWCKAPMALNCNPWDNSHGIIRWKVWHASAWCRSFLLVIVLSLKYTVIVTTSYQSKTNLCTLVVFLYPWPCTNDFSLTRAFETKRSEDHQGHVLI